MKNLILAVAVGALLAGCGSGMDMAMKSAEKAMEKGVAEGDYPGAIFLLNRDGERSVRAVGTEGREDIDPVTEQTIFRIFSMTKPVVSIATMQMVEEGLIDLDAPISTYIPELDNLQVMDTDGTIRDAARQPTVRDVMSHTSGFIYGQYADDGPMKDLYDANDPSDFYITSDEMIDRLSVLPLRFDPGSSWHYGVSTDVLGEIVSRVSGQALSDYLQIQIFDPLGMIDTGFDVPEEKWNRLAGNNGFVLIGPDADPLRESGGGGLYSTTADYEQFAKMLLNGGELGGHRFVREDTLKSMREDLFASGDVSKEYQISEDTGFGLGFGIFPPPAGKKDDVTYFWAGYAGTIFWIDPANDMYAIYMMQNPDLLFDYAVETRKWVYVPMAFGK